MQRTSLAEIVVGLLIVSTALPAAAQKTADGVGGKHACALLSPAAIHGLTGLSTSAGNAEERPFTSNCQYWGDVDVTVHIGNQTKVMFGRVRDTYVKAPAKLGYKIEQISGLADDAYFMTYNGKVEARAMLGGAIELGISLSGKLPAEAEAKKMALSLAKAAVAKMK